MKPYKYYQKLAKKMVKAADISNNICGLLNALKEAALDQEFNDYESFDKCPNDWDGEMGRRWRKLANELEKLALKI